MLAYAPHATDAARDGLSEIAVKSPVHMHWSGTRLAVKGLKGSVNIVAYTIHTPLGRYCLDTTVEVDPRRPGNHVSQHAGNAARSGVYAMPLQPLVGMHRPA